MEVVRTKVAGRIRRERRRSNRRYRDPVRIVNDIERVSLVSKSQQKRTIRKSIWRRSNDLKRDRVLFAN